MSPRAPLQPPPHPPIRVFAALWFRGEQTFTKHDPFIVSTHSFLRSLQENHTQRFLRSDERFLFVVKAVERGRNEAGMLFSLVSRCEGTWMHRYFEGGDE